MSYGSMYDHEDDYYYHQANRKGYLNDLLQDQGEIKEATKTKVLRARRLLREMVSKTPDLWDLKYNGSGLFPVFLAGPEQPQLELERISKPCVNLGTAITAVSSYVLLRDKNYALAFETDYPFRNFTGIKAPGHRLQGTLVGVSLDHLMKLDQYFDNGNSSNRAKVMVRVGDDYVKSYSYVADPRVMYKVVKDRNLQVCESTMHDHSKVYFYRK